MLYVCVGFSSSLRVYFCVFRVHGNVSWLKSHHRLKFLNARNHWNLVYVFRPWNELKRTHEFRKACNRKDRVAFLDVMLTVTQKGHSIGRWGTPEGSRWCDAKYPHSKFGVARIWQQMWWLRNAHRVALDPIDGVLDGSFHDGGVITGGWWRWNKCGDKFRSKTTRVWKTNKETTLSKTSNPSKFSSRPCECGYVI